MRIVTACISHESSTFTPVPTAYESFFERFGDVRGQAVVETFHGTNTPIGGFIEGALAHGFELVPLFRAEAHPSRPVPRPDFDRLVGELISGIAAAGAIDGVLLELHGSLVAEGVSDGDGHILAEVRRQVGCGVPVVVQLDIHSSVSQRMVEMADVLIGRETYPEIDMAARGRECADVLVRILTQGVRPTTALHRLPMIWGMNQVTTRSPMREAIAELHRIEALPGVVCGSIATGYALADVPDMGSSVFVVTDNDEPLARRCAEELATWIWERRADWQLPTPPSTAEALVTTRREARFPVIFADWNDNPGGGAPGDSTGMLRTFIDAGLEDACLLCIIDTEVARRCHEAGVGSTVTLDVGGKSAALQGPPVRMTAEVMGLSDGRYRFDGPMYAGLAANMGPSAYVRQGGIHVILTCGREQTFDTAFARTLGLDPRRMRYIGVKSAAHFRAAFEPWAAAVHVVSEPGVHSAESMEYRNLGRSVYPVSTSDPVSTSGIPLR